MADEPVSRIVPAALQANKLFALSRLDLSAMSIPSAWTVYWARFGDVFSLFDSQACGNQGGMYDLQSCSLVCGGGFSLLGVTLIAGRGGRGRSITTTFTPNCAASFGSFGA